MLVIPQRSTLHVTRRSNSHGYNMQGYLPQLLKEIQEAFPVGSIYTPADQASHSNTSWPSMNDLLREGKRIMFVSGEDYGAPMASLLFERSSGTVCGWQVQTTAIIHPPSKHS